MNTYRCLVFVIGFAVGIALPARSAVPPLISYQSLLRTSGGGPVADGPYEVAFRLYEDSAGGIPVWEESQTVQTSGGVFHVLLGAINPVSPGAFATDLYLGVGIDAGAEMTPRVRLVSVGYAMAAQNAYTLEGQTAADLDESSEITQAVASVADSISLSPFENLFRYYVSFAGAAGGVFPAFTTPADKSRYITGVYFVPLPPGAADRILTVNIGGDPVLTLFHDLGVGASDSWSSNGGAPLKVEPGQSVSLVTATAGTHAVLITGYEF
jgi:hypothetical protein